MLTANDVKNVVFNRATRGYKIAEVDAFLDQVIETIEQLHNANAELLHKLEVLADRIQEYRNEENSIRSALLTAQKSADKILKDAETERDRMLSEARQQADDAVRLSEEKSVIIANETREKVTLVLNDAKEKASKMLHDAKEKSDQMLYDATQGCKAEKEYLEFLKEQENLFRQRVVEMYKAQFELLKKGPEVIKELDRSMAQMKEPLPVNLPEQVVEEPAPVVSSDVEEPAVAEVVTGFTEPEDIPLPVSGTISQMEPAEEEETDEEEMQINNGFEIKRRYSDLKFGDDYCISEDDDYDDYGV
jgi:cell division initiation protein